MQKHQGNHAKNGTTAFLLTGPVLIEYILLLPQGILHQFAPLQFLPVEIHGGDLAVVVGLIIVDSPVGVAAGAVQGDLVLSLPQVDAAPLLLHGTQDVEKLADALFLPLPSD